MAAVVQINSIIPAGNVITVTGYIVLSGSYTTGGDVLNFATATADPSFIGLVAAIESSTCLNCDVWSEGGATINGSNSVAYDVVFSKSGTPSTVNPATGIKLKTAALNASPTSEHSAGAYESQYTGDTIGFMATFGKLI